METAASSTNVFPGSFSDLSDITSDSSGWLAPSEKPSKKKPTPNLHLSGVLKRNASSFPEKKLPHCLRNRICGVMNIVGSGFLICVVTILVMHYLMKSEDREIILTTPPGISLDLLKQKFDEALARTKEAIGSSTYEDPNFKQETGAVLMNVLSITRRRDPQVTYEGSEPEVSQWCRWGGVQLSEIQGAPGPAQRNITCTAPGIRLTFYLGLYDQRETKSFLKKLTRTDFNLPVCENLDPNTTVQELEELKFFMVEYMEKFMALVFMPIFNETLSRL